MTSLPLVPWMLSLPFVPTIVAALPSHVGLACAAAGAATARSDATSVTIARSVDFVRSFMTRPFGVVACVQPKVRAWWTCCHTRSREYDHGVDLDQVCGRSPRSWPCRAAPRSRCSVFQIAAEVDRILPNDSPTRKGSTVAIVLRDRPWAAVLADMIEGIVVANALGRSSSRSDPFGSLACGRYPGGRCRLVHLVALLSVDRRRRGIVGLCTPRRRRRQETAPSARTRPGRSGA